ncbi:MAG: Calx-beta domain-containing protein [Gammaproteobacteria bacterium]
MNHHTSCYRTAPSILALWLITGFTPAALAQKVGVNCEQSGGVNCISLIPDGTTASVQPAPLTSTITIPNGSCASVARVCVAAGIEHSWRGDLSVALTHGATTVPLVAANPSDDKADIHRGFVLETEFDGQSGDGAWNLVITDSTNGEFGALNNWTLGLCCGNACGSGLVAATPGLLTTEAGGTAQVSVDLTCPPFHQVTIPGIASSDTTEGTTPTTNLVFDQANAGQAQTITVTGQDDPVVDGDIPYTVTLGAVTVGAAFSPPVLPADLYTPPSVYAANDPADIALVNQDNDIDLAITKTDGISNAIPGQSVTYTITASNPTPGSVTGATVADTFPATLSACTWTCAGAGGGVCAASGTGNINDSVDLPANASVSYTATCTLAATATGSLANTATIAAPAGFVAQIDVNAANNSATDTDTIGPRPDLTITDVTVAESAGTATFTVTLGAAAAAGFTIDFATANGTATAGADYTAASGTLTFTGTAGESHTIAVPILQDTLVEPAETFFVNLSNISNATVTFAAQGTGTITDDDVPPPPQGAKLTATKTVDGQLQPGATITYTVIVTNSGGGAQADNPGNEFTDVLPAGLTLKTATATSGTAVADVPNNTATWNGALAANASVTITITAQINNDQSGQTIANQATLAFDANGDGTNEAAGVSDDPNTPAANDATAFTIAIAIPTLSVWSLLILSLILLSGAWHWRRRLPRGF